MGQDKQAQRHPATEHFRPLFAYDHLPEDLQQISRSAAYTAAEMIDKLEDGPELTAGLRKLLEAKDCFVRQALIDRQATEV